MRIKLMSMLWLLGCATAAVAAAASSSATSASSSSSAAGAAAAQATPTKLKRDAGLSYGSGLYHGPSHKYLPPSPSSSSHGHGYEYALGLGSHNGYDFGHHLDAVSYQQSRPHYPHHHHHHQQHHSLPHQPKVDTYIVQTSGGSGGAGSGSSISHGSYAGYGHGHGHGHGQGYKYAAPQSGGGSYIQVLSSGHKLPGSGTYLVATPTADYYAASHQSYHRPTSYTTPGRLSLSHSSGLEHQLAAIAGAGIGSGADEHHSSPSVSSLSSSGSSSLSGYNYEAPSIPFGKIPTLTTSYGVPLLPGYEHQPAHYDESLPEQDLDAETPNHSLQTEQHQTPVYALGHKGLGHFTYTASKPHALNTDIHPYSHPQQHPLPLALSHHQELSKAPFKPSAFLGAKHESSSGSSNSISGYDYATPTSLGYDYSQPQAPLYGAPGQSGDSATPIFEPEATYLPPATPTHGYH